MSRIYTVLAIALLGSPIVFAQKCPELGEESIIRLKKDISVLASDEFGGREPGTKGAEMAASYLEEQYKRMGLLPYLNEGFRQPFMIAVDVTFPKQKNYLVYNDDSLSLGHDYYPMKFSDNKEAQGELLYVKYGIEAPELKYNDYKRIRREKVAGRVFVMDISSPDGIHPHSAYLKYHDLGDRVRKAVEMGASAVILINLEETANDVSPSFRSVDNCGVPVVFVTDNELAKKISRKGEVILKTRLQQNEVEAYNIVGFIDNKVKNTVIIGAHYDHLGMGGSSSLHAGKPEIHNGADDNASGVAAMLEIARFLKKDESRRKSNYLFIAFSGEEKGLLGSAWFTDHLNKDEVDYFDYMLNMDMVGRLEDDLLAINGVGTSESWPSIIENAKCSGLSVKTSKSGVGPSDHTNFYYLDMPVLHFFTGTHSDYHKPSDDEEKINYKGELKVISHILDIIFQAQQQDKLKFTPTKEQSQMAPKFSVTLGVMPDYMYDKPGMRIDGVSEGKPGANAGLQKDDVIIHLGEVKVVDMMSYMKALGQFKKGDSAEVIYLRDGKEQRATIKF